MKLRMTRLMLAAMIVAGAVHALADGITVSEDKASTYVPTTIVNDGIPQPQRLKRLNEIAIQLLSPLEFTHFLRREVDFAPCFLG